MGANDADPMAAARAAMVAEQLQRRGIVDERVLDAMGRLPREAFLDPERRAVAYEDSPLPVGAGQTISQPFIVARMSELLAVEAGDRILDIGTGSGYQAAVLALLGARVVSIERHEVLAGSARERLQALGLGESIEIRVGDGSRGAADGAPWDGIVVGAAAPSVPDALREQLAIGGRLVIPVGPRDRQELLWIERSGPSDWIERSDGACIFVPLIGEAGFRDAGDPKGDGGEAGSAESGRTGPIGRWWRRRSGEGR